MQIVGAATIERDAVDGKAVPHCWFLKIVAIWLSSWNQSSARLNPTKDENGPGREPNATRQGGCDRGGGDRPGRAHPQSPEAEAPASSWSASTIRRRRSAPSSPTNSALPRSTTSIALLALPLDAVVIASPDALHREQMLAAFARGLHVFCEKPLCYGVADIDEVIAARDRAGKVLQVGYMKRFDPSYEAALRRLPGTRRDAALRLGRGERSRCLALLPAPRICRGDDVPADLIADGKAKQREQVARAVPGLTIRSIIRGFTGPYCSSIVHDVNAVHGLLDALGVGDGEIVGAAAFRQGRGRAGRRAAARRAGAVEHGASGRAATRRLPRAHLALFRRRRARAGIPVALPQPPADPADDPHERRPHAGRSRTSAPATRKPSSRS